MPPTCLLHVWLPILLCFPLPATNAEQLESALAHISLMNKISTGYVFLDVMLCLLVPVLMNSFVPRVYHAVHSCTWARAYKYSRKIVFKESNNRRLFPGGDMPIPPTSLLQQAVFAAINKNPELSVSLPIGEIQLGLAPRNNKKPPSTEPFMQPWSGGKPGGSCFRRFPDDLPNANEPLLNAVVSIVPPAGVWVEILKGVQFRHDESEIERRNEGQPSLSETIFCFRSNLHGGNVIIDNLVKDAFGEYQKEHRDVSDCTRYLYVPVNTALACSAQTTEDLQKATMCKRYALSNERTFGSFFHPEKEAILQLVDDFQNRTGKFAIPGYPRKLGFLLHGPPGTGKTSFIKALAQYTNRNVVSIPLSLIQTNQQLMDIMFDQRYALPGHELPVTLPFEDTIFVFEDVDAAGHVALRRAASQQQQWAKAQGNVTDLSISHHGGHYERESDMRNSQKLVEWVHKATSTLKMAGRSSTNVEADAGSSSMKPPPTFAAAEQKLVHSSSSSSSKEEGTTHVSSGDEQQPSNLVTVNKGKKKIVKRKPTDALNLAGLLNVLDGVVDTPGRIVVMTSNCPGKLDPALTRPGRINKHVFMGRLRWEQALQMARHYFADADDAVLQCFEKAWVDECWSPAELEALCAECGTMEELLQHLQLSTEEDEPAMLNDEL